MIRFYDSKGEQHPLSKNDVENFYLLRQADGSIRLCFDISPENRFYSQLVEESELEYGDNCYIVKKVKNGKIECDLNFDFLKRTVHKNYSSGSVLLMDLLSAHLPSDWTIVNAGVSGIRRTTTFDFCTDYDVVMSSMSTYGVYLEWSIKQKTVKVYLQSEAENTGEYLTDQLNLRKLSMQGDSLSLITRLYAYGKDGLSFSSINGGKEYVDNTDYVDKIVCGWWTDERYTVASELLAATREKVKNLSYPVRAYECDVVDLAKLNPKYSFLHFKLHKAVMLLDREHSIKVQHRIVQYKEYPHEPDRNVVTLSSVPQKISTKVNSIASSLEENKHITNAYQKASAALSELISNSLGVYYTEIKDETGASHFYLHDEPLLENSSTIYTHNAGGYAFTNSGWNGGNPDWQYGFAKDGNAVFNKVCAYGLKVADPYGWFAAEVSPDAFKIWQDGILKLDASYDGLNIYDGAITIYKGAGYYSERALYLDSDGNIAIDGYLTQIGSNHRALIGRNELGYSGFYLYDRQSKYQRNDGTYKPYLEVWTSTEYHTYIEGTNELKLGVSTIANESEGNYARVRIVPDGGYLYGAWNVYNLIVNGSTIDFLYDDGAAESGFIGTGTYGEGKCLLLKSDGVPLVMTYANDAGTDGPKIVLDSSAGKLYGAFDFNQTQNWNHNINAWSLGVKRNNVLYGNLWVTDNNELYISNEKYQGIKLGVKGTDSSYYSGISIYRQSSSSNNIKGEFHGSWSWGSDQDWSGRSFYVNVMYFGTSGYNIYKSTSNHLCLKSANSIYIMSGSTGRVNVESGGGELIGNWEIVDSNNYYRLTTSTSGGKLYGAWDFNQEQNFSYTINAPAFICKSGSTKILSLYVSSTSNACFNADNGKDFIFAVGSTSRLKCTSSGGNLYGSWYLGSSTAVTSDENKKNSIEDLSEKYSILFDSLRPVRYKYNDGTSNRFHTGFISQEVEQALSTAELDSSEFAGFVKTEDNEYYLRYEEFIALAVNEIQSLKKQNTELERKLNSVLEKLEV